ncbi:sensor histidine kinase [Parasedimentitalea psychrophila]|uniref:Sensor histidine kinase n=1 Tax=Parasedimentitalea psychrophila TaxID=2997337 RepID=A0A9Y2P5M6_9RHOB|nr:sensor histidine kinase [Parasedimentitalea psychrophila]WIY23760.1 sensor histidine kinase [Parasedimentitalea psychrophila]
MIENRPFATRARTVDHLGREQIADVPTAVSELWKNSYDAYASNVTMTLFQDEPLMVSLLDNGQGMTKADILEKWLVIGTESKVDSDGSTHKPLFGLEYRPKQGQKGIGRLSSAHVGPLLFMVSKSYASSEYVALLIDWRVFQNPYLILSDINTPILTAQDLDEVFEQLPDLADALKDNIAPKDKTNDDDSVKAKKARIREAWKLYDELEVSADHQTKTTTSDGQKNEIPSQSPSEKILKAIANSKFSQSFLERWEVAEGTSDHGTALLISDTNEVLEALLRGSEDEDRQSFVRTLIGFVDPFEKRDDPASDVVDTMSPRLELDYSVDVVKGADKENVISSRSEFSRSITDTLEHVIDGRVDINGVFIGTVKSLGNWVNDGRPITIEPPDDFKPPKGPTTQLGAFDFYAATMEQKRLNTTHTDSEFSYIDDGKFNVYNGLRVYRNGLRVMPYGRPDTDFFEIEKRRSMRAGTEFWNERRMFGRVGISQLSNPNLRDKAGREGFIVNTASRSLKRLVVNILMVSARRFFGSYSEIRKTEMPEINKKNREEKAQEAAREVAAKNRRQFRKNLKEQNKILPTKISEMRSRMSDFVIRAASDIPKGQELVEEGRQIIVAASVPGKPRDLKSLEDEYALYRSHISSVNEVVSDFSTELDKRINEIDPPEPWEILDKQLKRQQGRLSSRVTKWSRTIKNLQDGEGSRVGDLISERNKLMFRDGSIIVEQVRENRMSLVDASKAMTSLWQSIDAENEDIFENYIFALESLTESIDLQTIALVGEEENAELRSEVDRLNSLAQLGIAVEILGHELKAYDNMIGRGLDALPVGLRKDERVGGQIEMGYHGLTQQLQFLAPLQLSGEKLQRRISGVEIFDYLGKFFGPILDRLGVEFEASDAFKEFSVYGQPARLFPVFINLVNNSQYWVSHGGGPEKKIHLGVAGGRVIVSDSGPGVNEDDVRYLFTLFFTRKSSGGRGIGLYLCRANLAASFHEIAYVIKQDEKILPGANFAIKFKNADFSGNN